MKRLLIILALVAAPAFAGTITVGPASKDTTAQEDANALLRLQQENAANCVSVKLPVTCTNAQYHAAANSSPTVTIYPETNAGVAAYVLDRIFRMLDRDVPVEVQSISKEDARSAWDSASPAQQQAACVALGKDSTCRGSSGAGQGLSANQKIQ